MTGASVFCAIDTPDLARAQTLAGALAGHIGGLKIGKEFFYTHGVNGYQTLAAYGQPIFLDLKLHDIPNTVASAVRALAPMKPAWLNVHAGGGAAMMRAAADAAKQSGVKKNEARQSVTAQAGPEAVPIMLAVTVLTSLTDADLHDMGIAGSPRDQVLRLAALAAKNDMDGVVCSAHEIADLRTEMGPDFKLVVPGIRPAGTDANDQKRIMTPLQAREAGADILVIGRPITGSDDPQGAAHAIVASLTVENSGMVRGK